MHENMKKKIRLLCCIHDLRGRGAERVLITLLNKFDRERYQIALFVYHSLFAMKLPEDIEVLSAGIESYPPAAGLFTKLRMNLLKVFALGRALRRYKPDVVLSVAGTNETLITARYLFYNKMKVILSEHTMPSASTMEAKNRFVRYLMNRLISLTYPRADLIITPSKGVMDDLYRNYGIPQETIKVIPNPLDMEQIQDASRMQSNFVFPDDGCFRIGYIGSLSREKNVPCLLKACAILKRDKLPVRLFIVGEGAAKESLKNLSKEIGIEDCVHFLGYQENPYVILRNLDVLVVPSFYETFSYAMIEAMACGVPVVSSKWPGCEDLYRDMENCLLVPVDDHKQLAAAIEKLIRQDGLKDILVSKGLELVKRYDAKLVVEQYDAAIKSVLNPGTSV